MSARGQRRYSVNIYEELKAITVEFDPYLILVTTPSNVDHCGIIQWLEKNKQNFQQKGIFSPLSNPSTIDDYPEVKLSLEFPEFVDSKLETLHKKLTAIPNVTNVGIFDSHTPIDEHDSQIINMGYMDEFQKAQIAKLTKDRYIDFLWGRWHFRSKFIDKIGRPLYTISQYDNTKIITTLTKDRDHILYVIAEKYAGDDKTIKSLSEIEMS